MVRRGERSVSPVRSVLGLDREYVDPEPVADAADRSLARVLTLRYVIASTAIFLVAGLLGALMRQSQADIYRLSDEFYYAVMTAHGLGAFVGWAAFAVMGLSYWVLSEVGFPLGRLGAALARATFWLMVVGVLGVVVTTLFYSFGASWVFLYPLPFGSAGVWGDTTTAFFSLSVLLVGLSIIAWCVSILVIVTGPGLRSPSTSWVRRVFTAMGFGFLSQRRFPSERPVPYSVIPLTVIAIDMIIATLPLAGLLIAMIAQSIWPAFTVDPLLAKNVLWFFGHPVVYLLLFPAVAIYYLLVPRYARRPLVAGNIIAVGWTIAVIANVTVWAYHMYLDYPNGIQAAINTAMMPITFALTLVSALSIYSLFFTIFRSRWTWNAASTALFVGIVSWLLSGLSGVINATIGFNTFVHNTLWVVGHFHHMALMNIGLVIFGGIYAFLPRLLGRRLYSERLGLWHVWLTFFAGTAVSVVWLAQGLDGAPRRFSELPGAYDASNWSSVPLIAVLGLAQLLFVWNMIMTARGRTSTATDRASLAGVEQPRLTSPALQGFAMVSTVMLMGALALGGWAIGDATKDPNRSDTYVAGVREVAAPGPGATDAGLEIFTATGCGGCHALSAAGATGAVGPNLDETQLDSAAIAQVVAEGSGVMPGYSGQLSTDEIDALASYLAGVSSP
jgi:cytochrome c oxidase subunit I